MKRPLGGRLVGNSQIAKYLGVSHVTLWKWKNDPSMQFPAAGYRIKGREITSLDVIDDWLRDQAIKKTLGVEEIAAEVRTTYADGVPRKKKK